jgi:hypothetical protein
MASQATKSGAIWLNGHLVIANTCIVRQLHSIGKLDCCGAMRVIKI